MGKVNKIICVIGCAIALSACARPTQWEEFRTAPRDSYDFTIDVEDSLVLYDFSFYTRVDAGIKKMVYPLKLDIQWVSPSDSCYSETVYMNVNTKEVTENWYRTGMSFPACGKWTLRVGVSPQTKEFRGLGLIWKEQKWDTTN